MVLGRSRSYLDHLIRNGELLRSSKSPEELLFAVAQRGMVERLDISSEIVDKILTFAHGKGEPTVHERENLFRNYFAASLRESPEIEKAFYIDLSQFDVEWGIHFLKFLLPGESFSHSADVENFVAGFSKIVENYMEHAFSIFLGKILWSEVELGNIESNELGSVFMWGFCRFCS